MAKSHNQKAKILFLEQMLRETGNGKVVTMQEILARLTEHGIPAERKSIYDDMEALRSFGMDIRFKRGKPGGYYLEGEQTVPARTEQEQDSSYGRKEEGGACTFKSAEPVGKTKKVKLLCASEAEKQVKEYFGEDAVYKQKSPGYFSVSAECTPDPLFYGWLTAMGAAVHMVKPKKAVQQYRDYLKMLIKEYKPLS